MIKFIEQLTYPILVQISLLRFKPKSLRKNAHKYLNCMKLLPKFDLNKAKLKYWPINVKLPSKMHANKYTQMIF